MNLIIIFGPPAVGKMTVGQELAKITGYKLLHNHMTIDLVTELFDFGTPSFKKLVPAFRKMLVTEAAESGLDGLIFTFVWDFSNKKDKLLLDSLSHEVSQRGGQTYFAELQAPMETRLVRNSTENRLVHKKKMDLYKTEANMIRMQDECLMHSAGDFPYPDRHVAIDNEHMSPSTSAREIARAFNLSVL